MVAAAGFPSTGIDFFNRRGRRVGRLDATDEHARYSASNVMIRRAHLHDVLLEAVSATGLDVKWGHRLERLDEEPAAVRATFTNGTIMKGDVVVGCDGVNSVVRQHVAGAEHSPEYLGLVNIGGFSPSSPSGVRPGRQRMVFGQRAFFGSYVAATGETWWFSNVPRPAQPSRSGPADTTPQEWIDTLLRLHANDPPEVTEILTSSELPVGAWPVTDLASLPRWHTKRVCLLGDAAHATSPSAGQGAALAIEDSVILAHLIGIHADVHDAFEPFEQARRQRVETLVATGRRNSSHKVPGPIGGALRDLFLPVFLRLGMRATRQAHLFTPPDLAARSPRQSP